MTWAVAAGGLIVLLVLVAAVGALLPRGHSASLAAHYPVPPETLWGVLSDVRAYPSWRPRVRRVEVLPPEHGQLRWREHTRRGVVTLKAIVSEPPRRLVVRIADEDLPFGGSRIYEIAREPEGSLLTVRETGEVYHPVVRFLSRIVWGRDARVRRLHAALRRRLGVRRGGR